MNHRKANPLLVTLLDHTLPAPLEGEVRAHAESCAICTSDLAEHSAAETLLERLPLALVPREASPAADARLASLARWAAAPAISWSEWLGIRAVGAFGATMLVVAVISAGRWEPLMEMPYESSPISVAAVPSASVTPYTWH
jgi:anti-sigma factor RsiW